MNDRAHPGGREDHTAAAEGQERPRPVVVAVAGDAIEAAIWVDALRSAGIEAVTFERGESAAFGGAQSVASTHPVLVPSSSLGAARNVIAQFAGARALAPVRDEGDDRRGHREGLVAVALAVLAIVFVLLALRATGVA